MVLMFLGNIFSGKIIARHGPKFPILLGFILETIGFSLFFIIMYSNLSYFIMVIPLLVIGLSVSFVMPSLTVVIIRATPQDKVGFASATFNMSRQIGSLLGVAIIGSTINLVPDFVTGMNIALLLVMLNCIASVLSTICFIKN
jgi:MFS transporter, DHA2 family, methylenomycin A resistance protein